MAVFLRPRHSALSADSRFLILLYVGSHLRQHDRSSTAVSYGVRLGLVQQVNPAATSHTYDESATLSA